MKARLGAEQADVKALRITANGKPREVAMESTIAELLAALGLDAARVVVELNGEPLERERFGAALQAGDRVEIAQMVGGG